MEGRVAGLYISQTSGIPGAYSTIQLSGLNSIANGNRPLYIVDGVPFSSASLTSSDIGGGAVGNPYSFNNFRYTILNDCSGMRPFNDLNPADIERIISLLSNIPVPAMQRFI